MRNTFINKLTELAAIHKNVWLIAGDLGYSVLDGFAERYPTRFVNAGVAEQNMTGLAAGLAMEGAKPFTYSIANFPTFRCLEQIRNDVCYHNLDVRVVSVGAGLSYGTHGYTHYGIEDIAIMRPLPNMAILCPADPKEAVRCAEISLAHTGPMYIRLGKNGEPDMHHAQCSFTLGEPLELLRGTDATILSTGSIGYTGLQAAQSLRASGWDVGFISLPTLRPLNVGRLHTLLGSCRRLFTLEEHVEAGGLFSLICEISQREELGYRITPLCVPHDLPCLGNQGFLLQALGLDAAGIAQRISAQLT